MLKLAYRFCVPRNPVTMQSINSTIDSTLPTVQIGIAGGSAGAWTGSRLRGPPPYAGTVAKRPTMTKDRTSAAPVPKAYIENGTGIV